MSVTFGNATYVFDFIPYPRYKTHLRLSGYAITGAPGQLVIYALFKYYNKNYIESMVKLANTQRHPVRFLRNVKLSAYADNIITK